MSNQIEQINTPSGRLYKTPDGKCYPSATTVVGILNKKKIEEWRQKVGEEEANKVSKWASEHGTRFHELMENTLQNGTQHIDLFNEFCVVYPKLLREIYPHISNVVAIEERMYSDTLEVAGTADLIAEWNGELAILDWKTSRHKKAPSDCLSYWLQLASYAVMLKERKGLEVKKLVLLFNENDEDCYYYEQSNIQLWIERFKKIREIYRQQTGQ